LPALGAAGEVPKIVDRVVVDLRMEVGAGVSEQRRERPVGIGHPALVVHNRSSFSSSFACGEANIVSNSYPVLSRLGLKAIRNLPPSKLSIGTAKGSRRPAWMARSRARSPGTATFSAE